MAIKKINALVIVNKDIVGKVEHHKWEDPQT